MLRIKSEGAVLLKPNVMIYEPGDVFWRERRWRLALVDGAIGNDVDAPPRRRCVFFSLQRNESLVSSLPPP